MSGERGQVAPLALGLMLVVLAVCGLAVDGTRLFLARRTLQNAADAAVLAAAGDVDTARYRASGGRSVQLDPPQGTRTLLTYLRERAVRARAEVRVEREEVVLVLRDEVEATFLSLVGIDAIPVAIEARSSPSGGSPEP